MKRLGIMIGALALVLGMSQCRKPVETINAEPQGETVDVTLSVTSGADKTEITPMGVVTWKAGDKLYVVGVTDGLLGIVSATAAGDPVNFTGSIKALTKAQTLKFYYVGDSEFTLDGSGEYTFSIENQDGSLAGIAANNQLMFGKTASEVAVGTTDLGTISMTSFIAIAHFNIHNDGGNAVSWVNVDKITYKETVYPSIIFSPKRFDPSDGISYRIQAMGTINVAFTSQSSKDCYLAFLPGDQGFSFSCGGAATQMEKTIVANTFYNAGGSAIDVTVEEVAYLPGKFSVGASSKVKFSKGNLQYLGNSDGTGEWRFAAHQYDRMGDGPTSGTENQGNVDLGTTGHGSWTYNTGSGNVGGSETAEDKAAARDLFGWGTTGHEYEGHGSCYQPYSTGINDYGPGGNLTGDSDWGCNTIYYNGTVTPSGWRTLTKGEWNYLLFERIVNGGSDEGHCWKLATINSDATDNSRVYGLLIFPDGYTGSTSATSYTKAEWSAMEGSGVVFLPAAGYREGTIIPSGGAEVEVCDVGLGGYYWSSTMSTSSFPKNSAYCAFFSHGDASIEEGVSVEAVFKGGGNSVRLVRSAE